MLRLNSLAPDIVEAILQNYAPDHISLRTLNRGIARGSAEQRRQLREFNRGVVRNFKLAKVKSYLLDRGACLSFLTPCAQA